MNQKMQGMKQTANVSNTSFTDRIKKKQKKKKISFIEIYGPENASNTFVKL